MSIGCIIEDYFVKLALFHQKKGLRIMLLQPWRMERKGKPLEENTCIYLKPNFGALGMDISNQFAPVILAMPTTTIHPVRAHTYLNWYQINKVPAGYDEIDSMYLTNAHHMNKTSDLSSMRDWLAMKSRKEILKHISIFGQRVFYLTALVWYIVLTIMTLAVRVHVHCMPL
jgi:hypothetical protein